MSRTPDSTYEGYRIFIVAVPLDDGRWLATAEVDKPRADHFETLQAFGGPSYGKSEQEARESALADTRRKIDDVMARPTI